MINIKKILSRNTHSLPNRKCLLKMNTYYMKTVDIQIKIRKLMSSLCGLKYKSSKKGYYFLAGTNFQNEISTFQYTYKKHFCKFNDDNNDKKISNNDEEENLESLIEEKIKILKSFKFESSKKENLFNVYDDSDFLLKYLKREDPNFQLAIEISLFTIASIKDKKNTLILKKKIKENEFNIDDDVNLYKALYFNLINIWRIFADLEKSKKQSLEKEKSTATSNNMITFANLNFNSEISKDNLKDDVNHQINIENKEVMNTIDKTRENQENSPEKLYKEINNNNIYTNEYEKQKQYHISGKNNINKPQDDQADPNKIINQILHYNSLPIYLEAIRDDIHCSYIYEDESSSIPIKNTNEVKINENSQKYKLSEFINLSFRIAEILYDTLMKNNNNNNDIKNFTYILFEIYKLYYFYCLLRLKDEKKALVYMDKLYTIYKNFTIEGHYEYSHSISIFHTELTTLNKQDHIYDFLNMMESKLKIDSNTKSNQDCERITDLAISISNIYATLLDFEKVISLMQNFLENLNELKNSETINTNISKETILKSFIKIYRILGNVYGNLNEKDKAQLLCNKALDINNNFNDLDYIFNYFDFNYTLTSLATRPEFNESEYMHYFYKIKDLYDELFSDDYYNKKDVQILENGQKGEIDNTEGEVKGNSNSQVKNNLLKLQQKINNDDLRLKVNQIIILNSGSQKFQEIKGNFLLGYMYLIASLINYRERYSLSENFEDEPKEVQEELINLIKHGILELHSLAISSYFNEKIGLNYIVDWKVIIAENCIKYNLFEEGIRHCIDLLQLSYFDDKIRNMIYIENIKDPIDFLLKNLIEYSIHIKSQDLQDAYENILDLYEFDSTKSNKNRNK